MRDFLTPVCADGLPFSCTLAATCLVLLVCVTKAAAQAPVPLPPPRPAELATTASQGTTPAPEPGSVAATPTLPQPSPEDNEALRAQILASGHVIGAALPLVADAGGCGMVAPLRVDAIVLADGHKVGLAPPAVMRGALASALADWIRDDLANAIADKDDRLATIEGTGGYECRTRNRLFAATLSQHGIGNALDMQAFVTARGKRFVVGVPDG